MKEAYDQSVYLQNLDVADDDLLADAIRRDRHVRSCRIAEGLQERQFREAEAREREVKDRVTST